ncbi:MAG: cupin domain-containing protein [Gemmatimonadales bacterium]
MKAASDFFPARFTPSVIAWSLPVLFVLGKGAYGDASMKHVKRKEETPAPGELLRHDIAGVPGREFVVVRVRLAPGERSAPHHHTAPLIAYVLSGAIRSRLGQDRHRVFRAGEAFYESADVRHESENASRTRPAVFLVVFLAPSNIALTVSEAR